METTAVENDESYQHEDDANDVSKQITKLMSVVPTAKLAERLVEGTFGAAVYVAQLQFRGKARSQTENGLIL